MTHLELTKWAFLLAHEMPSRGGTSFYQFLPYQYGPFSFCLYQETEALVHDGYLVDEGKVWRLVQDVERPTADLPCCVRQDAARVVERFRGKTADSLKDYVYQRFPWFTANSTVKKLHARPVAPLGVYTIGYEGWLVDGFLDLLIRTGIQRIVDVRSNPIARRYGFHKSTLSRLCGKVQIDYLHYPQLGIPSELRRDLKTSGDYETLFAQYESDTLVSGSASVDKVVGLIKEKPTALMCMEADPSKCHRNRLAMVIAAKTMLPVHSLRGPDETGV